MTSPGLAAFRKRLASLSLFAVFSVAAGCAGTPKPAVNAAPPAPGGGAGPLAPVEKKPEPPRAILLWSGPIGETLPPPLAQAFADRVEVLEGGALSGAARVLLTARRALGEMRCSEALAPLAQAADRVLDEVPLPDGRPLLGELYGVMLLCADRVNDAVAAQKASAALRAMQAQVPADVALVLARYDLPPRFGPPRAPVHLESDPPGAVVLRNLIPVGVTPLDVAGGVPAEDFLDVEMPGFRKQHRPLGSNQQIILSLRPEDRAPVLLDRAAMFPPGSDEQGAVLKVLAGTAGAQVLKSRLILVAGPKQRGGMPTAGELLLARVYDLDRKSFIGPPVEIAAGAANSQAQSMIALCDEGKKSGPGVAAGPALAAGKAPPAKKSWLPFRNTKWYTWVVAGGVAALIAGLLIAEKVSPEKVTISATK